MDLQGHVDAIFDRPAGLGTSLAMVVMHDGRVVAERYGAMPGNMFEPEQHLDQHSTLVSWSIAKSICHAAFGILVGDELVDPSAPADVPEWSQTDKATITLTDLLEMRSGLHFVEDYVDETASNCIEMLFGDGSGDCAGYAAAQPVDHPPGTVWNYSSGTTNIVARLIGETVGGGRAATEAFLQARLFDPLGMTSATARFDTAGTWIASSYVYATARDFARFGELYRNDGCTPDHERLLPEGWVNHARTKVAHDPADGLRHGLDYGRHWWMWPQYPGSLAAHGYEGQYIVVVPNRALTVVHLGKNDAAVRAHLHTMLDHLIASVPTR